MPTSGSKPAQRSPRTARHAALLVLAFVSSALAATSTLAGCYGDEDDDANAVPRVPDYSPGDAAPPNPLAPGVRPAPDPTGTTPTPLPPDGGTPDRSAPPQDAPTESAPADTGAPDAVGQ